MKTPLFKNSFVKNILSALAVAGFGFILLNLTFILDFLLHLLVMGFIRIFIPINPIVDYWFPPVMHLLFVAIIGTVSWFILKSKTPVLLKAIYSTVPLAVIFVTLGMFLHRWPIIAFSFGSLFGLGVLYYLYQTKRSWLYYYTVILVGGTLTIFTLLGGEI